MSEHRMLPGYFASLRPGEWVIPRSQLGPWCWPDPCPFPRLRLWRWHK